MSPKGLLETAANIFDSKKPILRQKNASDTFRFFRVFLLFEITVSEKSIAMEETCIKTQKTAHFFFVQF
jgi:hypothetical protein